MRPENNSPSDPSTHKLTTESESATSGVTDWERERDAAADTMYSKYDRMWTEDNDYHFLSEALREALDFGHARGLSEPKGDAPGGLEYLCEQLEKERDELRIASARLFSDAGRLTEERDRYRVALERIEKQSDDMMVRKIAREALKVDSGAGKGET